ncbi:DUF4232 domain-containing protein [Streptomyces sp. KL118A]|uniref:DUF4232 domain-containing protein n=1 Tax=Streptomyces sp. KL118A TaxID=3045153 RepID=UPI00278BC274|nr:DUF4232 domain-containing protein [Streptomyces sp. KL118A]
MRTSRSRSTVLAATGAAVFALSLTACGGGGSDTESAGAQTPETTVSVGASRSADADAGAGADTDTGAVKASASGGKRAAAAAPACTTKDVTLSAARHGGPPYTHIVLTAKNKSGRSCTMTGFPEIQFLESHKQNVPSVAKSRPAAPVVLKAGAPAYALVKVSDGGVDENNEPVSAFSVTLQGGGGMAAVRAPGSGGIAVDPAKSLTGYWTYELRNGADEF